MPAYNGEVKYTVHLWDCVGPDFIIMNNHNHSTNLVAIPWSVSSVNSFLIEPNSWVLSLFLHVTMFALSFIHVSVLHECGLLVFHATDN